ncbi:nucleotidyltransferase domain-containing protein [Rhodoferax sediminis]|uniref:Nucleotidyltransferase domain-containing protein n=1 Tax=Rhodoferax sediminis TaxID=2509614 RepID=A0A515D7S9_9BURK|nr:nucleotidyltransferase domain-containing protein [Rhodoferax sediminis]QDL36459.1 nucleotidyltransferase domain-containing protein [Rhodoferax sediminis]
MDTHHPINPAVRAQVLEQLADIERRENVRILYACESGSRGWGFASPDSDYDVRFIFVRPLNQYLRLYPPRDVIEETPGPVFDVNGWDLRKALLLLAKGNATVVEWLSSSVVYRAETGFLAEMHHAVASVHRPERLFHHYLHMARSNYREYLQGEMVRAKKYLYVLRPVLAALWVIERKDAPPIAFETLVDEVVTDLVVKADIAGLLVMKRAAGEQEYFPRRPVLNRFLEETL